MADLRLSSLGRRSCQRLSAMLPLAGKANSETLLQGSDGEISIGERVSLWTVRLPLVAIGERLWSQVGKMFARCHWLQVIRIDALRSSADVVQVQFIWQCVAVQLVRSAVGWFNDQTRGFCSRDVQPSVAIFGGVSNGIDPAPSIYVACDSLVEALQHRTASVSMSRSKRLPQALLLVVRVAKSLTMHLRVTSIELAHASVL